MTLQIEVVEAISKLPVPELCVPEVLVRSTSKSRRAEIAVLHISDVQWGKVTASYNSQVAGDRLQELAVRVSKVVAARKSGAKIDELRIYLGGDIVEGENIFPGQKSLIDQPVQAQAIHGAAPSIAKLVLRLLQDFQRIKIESVRGNHGRDSKESPSNWDEVCYEITKHMLSNKRISFGPIGEWFRVDRIFDWGNLLVHGNQISGALGGNGFKTKVAGWIDAIPDPWDYLWLGHFHQMSSWVVNKRVVLVNGTTESDNEYAQESFAAVGVPSQRLAFFDEKYGLIADYPMYLTERKPNRRN